MALNQGRLLLAAGGDCENFGSTSSYDEGPSRLVEVEGSHLRSYCRNRIEVDSR